VIVKHCSSGASAVITEEQQTTPPSPDNCTADDVEPGTVVAIFLEQYDEVPQLGRVVQITVEGVEVEWLAGSYSGTLVCKYKASITPYINIRFLEDLQEESGKAL
jgi:hypothetical protein